MGRKQCLQLVFVNYPASNIHPNVTVHHNMGGKRVRMKILSDTISVNGNFEIITQITITEGVATSFTRGSRMVDGFNYSYAGVSNFTWPNQERTIFLSVIPTATTNTQRFTDLDPPGDYVHDQVQLIGNRLTFQQTAVGGNGGDRSYQIALREMWLELEEIE